jgi:hypothetical protein
MSSAKLLACRCGLHFLEGHSFGSVRAERLQGLTPKQESLGGKLIARGRRGTAAEKLKEFRFSFRFNHQRIQMANAEAKRAPGDRSRKLALHIFLDQLIKS